jgi:hypothetical protein
MRRSAALAVAAALAAGCGQGGGGGDMRPEPPAMQSSIDLTRPTPANVLRRCDEVTDETTVPVRCPRSLPGRGPWSVEHRNFGDGASEWLMDLAAFGRGRFPFHLLIGARDPAWDLRTDGSRWPRRGQHPGAALRLVGARALEPGGSPRPRVVRPRVVAATRVAGHRALLLRVAAYPAGGLHGGHLAVVWNQEGVGHLVSLHVPEQPAARRREREWLLATAASMARTAPRRPPEGARGRVEVRPAVGGPQTAFRFRAPLIEPWPDEDPSGDNYHVVFRGSGGRGCRGARRFQLGFFPQRGMRVVIGRALPRPSFCPGTYRGHVELRDFHAGERLEVRRVGRFSFRVR